MSGHASAAGGAGVGPSRRQWDVEAYTQRARERDREHRERAAENEERVKQGKRPLGRRRNDLPKPTQTMQAHGDLSLDANLGTTTMVDDARGGQRGPGYYCELCKRMCKDSVGYLDHINGRMHLRRLGQTTQTARSTLDQVRAKLAAVRAERALGRTAAERYDFDARIRQIAQEQRAEHEAQRQRRREERARRKEAKRAPTPPPATPDDAAMMAAMGFANFGSSRR
ncbi:U4/U6.U5 snRNP associated protein [Malassezia furfur]|uniref:U4/U6.U5 snRNP associated protein n=1 Tax=Malassezia furfur TaxID=55194 RepID=A0ABY8EP09_MALFU|nr:SNU23 [Malassezia furfur]WFD47288.1 U4/U6.U5 snRNP associated protein [Malassezia furfur]